MAAPPEEEQWQHIALKIYHEKKNCGTEMVELVISYPQQKCVSCKKKIRTYCVCSPGIYRCNECFAEHLIDVEN